MQWVEAIRTTGYLLIVIPITLMVLPADGANNVWIDEFGIEYTTNDVGSWFRISPYIIEEREDPFVTVLTRQNSNFEKLVEYEKNRAQWSEWGISPCESGCDLGLLSIVPASASVVSEHHFNPSYDGTKGLVSIGFDHVFSEHYQASAYMHRKGIIGTYYVVTGRVGDNSFMDYDQIRRAQSHGFEIMSHTQIHYRFVGDISGHDPDLVQSEIVDSKQILISEGFDVVGFVPSHGFLDDELRSVVIENYQFTGQHRGQFNTVDSLKKTEQTNGIKTFNSDGVNSVNYTIDDIKEMIDTAIAQKYYLNLNFHQLVKSNPTGNQTTFSMFKEIVDYIALKKDAGLVDNNTHRGALGF